LKRQVSAVVILNNLGKGLYMDMPSFYQALPIMTTELAPNTAKFANPALGEEVKDATVLYVAKASYRSATFGDQHFLLDQVETAKYSPTAKSKPGWSVAIVYCGWFGTRLKTRGIALRYQIDG
jgi:hypothetical protein